MRYNHERHKKPDRRRCGLNDDVMEMLHISKSFHGIKALDDISLPLRQGEIHALLGDTGAGKSTLLRVLCGLCQPDGGQIYLDGKKVRIRSPRRAIRLGSGMASQPSRLVEDFSVLDNIILGAEDDFLGVLIKKRARETVMALSEQYGLPVDPEARIEEISTGMKQRVEILKMLYRDSSILLFDEPAAALTPQKADQLFALLRTLAREGRTILFSTAKPSEALSADRCTVLRNGKLRDTVNTSDTYEEALSRMMGGAGAPLEKKEISVGSVVLEVRDVAVAGKPRGMNAVQSVNFEVRAGEIVCLTGIEGNGQTEFVSALMGLTPLKSGRVRLNRREITRLSVRDRARAGISHIPESPRTRGLLPDHTLAENLALQRYWEPAFQESGWIRKDATRRYADRLIQQYGLPAANGSGAIVGALSTSCQMRSVAAREIDRGCELLVAVQPTRGLNRSDADAIRRQILSVRDSRKAVLLVSLDLDEVMALADRILVMCQGEIVGEFDPKYTTARELGLYMAGVRRKGDEVRFDDD